MVGEGPYTMDGDKHANLVCIIVNGKGKKSFMALATGVEKVDKKDCLSLFLFLIKRFW
jgi:hypothetical protein